MNLKPGVLLLLIALVSFPAAAAEYSQGDLQLVLNETTGRFLLYYTGGDKAQALFANEDPRSSFLSVIVNDRTYKMGDSAGFRTRLAGDNSNPSLIFESSFLTVTEEFSFIPIPNSAAPDAVRIQITIENRSDQQLNTGARFLLDTNLGEGSPGYPFTTDLRTINSETLMTGADRDRYWTDQNGKISLTGTFITGSSLDPDSIHISNWKRLNDVTWKASFQAGRNFNFPPYSIGDAAVCYYFEPAVLGRGEKRSMAFTLILNYDPAQDTGMTTLLPPPPEIAIPAPVAIHNVARIEAENSLQQDLTALEKLIAEIEEHIASGTASDEDIANIEFALNKIRAKYGSGNTPR